MKLRELLKKILNDLDDIQLDNEVKFVNKENNGFDIMSIKHSNITGIIWLQEER
jgi:hypothetical protein